jgi:hypothetical protein
MIRHHHCDMKRLIICLGMVLSSLSHGAGLDFTATLKEIEAPADAKKVTADFEFTNRSNKTVKVAKYDAGCSCMAVGIKDSKLAYAPGESGLLRADFEMGNFSGTVDKSVALWLDDDPPEKPSVNLTVRVHIPVLVAIEPKTVKWEVGAEAAPQTIRITMNHSEPIHVKGVTSTSEVFRFELKTIEDGKSYELVVTPADISTPGLAVMRIETDCAVERHRLQQAFAMVRKALNNAKP